MKGLVCHDVREGRLYLSALSLVDTAQIGPVCEPGWPVMTLKVYISLTKTSVSNAVKMISSRCSESPTLLHTKSNLYHIIIVVVAHHYLARPVR